MLLGSAKERRVQGNWAGPVFKNVFRPRVYCVSIGVARRGLAACHEASNNPGNVLQLSISLLDLRT